MDSNKHTRIARAFAATLGVAGACVLAGWQFHIPALKGELFQTYIAPNTGFLFLLSGASILLRHSASLWLRRMATVLGAFIFLFGAATVLEYLVGVSFGIDGLLMSHRLSDWYVPVPRGRISPTTALSFTLAGLSLMTLRSTSRVPVSDALAGLVSLMSYYGLVGYFYNAGLLYGRVTAIHTLLLSQILATALWCSSRERRFVKLVTSEYAGGFVARRVTVAILILLPLFGWLEIRGRQTEVFPREVGIAVLVVALATVFTALVLHTASVLNNVDQRRTQAEATLIRTEKLAAVGRMAATIAHEINNPLNAVTNLLYLIRNSQRGSEEQKMYLERAEEELDRVATIVKQTLGFYRDSATATPVDPVSLVGDVLYTYGPRFANKGVKVNQDFQCEEKVFCVGSEIRQVVLNLIANALDACPNADGVIDVCVLGKNGHVCVEVANNGVGIAPANRARVFEAFFTTKQDFGTGLGLWVSKQLIEKNGGKISLAHSTPEAGNTKFVVELPVYEDVVARSG